MKHTRTLRTRIIHALADVPLSVRGLAASLGITVTAVEGALLDMPDRVRAIGDGRWTLAEPWEQPSAEPPTYAGWEPEEWPVPVTIGGW